MGVEQEPHLFFFLWVTGGFPIRKVRDGADDIAMNRHGTHTCTKLGTMFGGRRGCYLRDRVAEASDEDGLAGLPDFFKDREAGGLKFRDGDFFHDAAPNLRKDSIRLDYSQTIVYLW